MRARKSRVETDGLLEERDALAQRPLTALPPQVPRLEIAFVGRHVARAYGARPAVRTRELDLQRIGDLDCDLLLYLKDIGEVPIPRLGPEVAIGTRVDELRRHANALLVPPHAAFQDVCHLQRRRHAAQIQFAPAERERRSPRWNAQASDLRERVQNLLGQAVGEVLRVGRVAQVDEWQHRDRLLRDGRGRDVDRRRGCRGRPRWRLARAVVAPEDPAAQQEKQREDRELRCRNALLSAVAVVPGDDQDDRQSDQQRERRELL